MFENRHVNTTILAAAVLAASAGAGIRATGPQSAAAKSALPPLDACTLLTKQDAAAALGETVEQKPIRPGGSMPGVDVAACDYEAPSRSHIQVTVWRPFGDSVAMFMQMYKSECMKKEPAPGLGDLGCWYNKDHHELQMIKGANIMTFEIRRSGNTSDALMTVAKKALPRLP